MVVRPLLLLLLGLLPARGLRLIALVFL